MGFRLSAHSPAGADHAARRSRSPPARLRPSRRRSAPPSPPPARGAGGAAPARPAPPISEAPVGPLPGSVQDFVINVGDRVYFDFDAYSIRPDAADDPGPAGGVAERYPGGPGAHRGQLRRTRHARVQPRPRRAAGQFGARVPRRPRRRRRPDRHRLLRQGAADRPRHRRGRLVAQPQRPHRHHRRRAVRRWAMGGPLALGGEGGTHRETMGGQGVAQGSRATSTSPRRLAVARTDRCDGRQRDPHPPTPCGRGPLLLPQREKGCMAMRRAKGRSHF